MPNSVAVANEEPLPLTSPSGNASHRSPGTMQQSDGTSMVPHTRVTAANTPLSDVLPPVTVRIAGRTMTLRGISQLEVQMFTVSARRQLLELISAASIRTVIEQPFFGFPRTLKAVRTTDSNQSGSVIFTAECRELLGSVVPSLPKYLVIKMLPYYLHPLYPELGRFTRSESHLCRADPSNTEASAMLRARPLILAGALPNVALLYKFIVVKDWRVVNNGMPIAALNRWVAMATRVPPEIRHAAVIMLVEYCRGGSLRQRAKAGGLTSHQWRSVLWQVLYTLAVLNKAMPDFRHNDLHLGNMLLQDTETTPQSCWRYDFEGRTYHVHNTGLSPRIFDFDWASADCLPNGKMQRVSQSPNFPRMKGPPVFDVHYMLNCVHSYSSTPKQVKQFIRSVYPAELLKGDNQWTCKRRLTRGAVDHFGEKLPTPASLMRHEWFETYRRGPDRRIVLESYQYNGQPP